jgi:hypothetical protein
MWHAIKLLSSLNYLAMYYLAFMLLLYHCLLFHLSDICIFINADACQLGVHASLDLNIHCEVVEGREDIV